MKVMTLTGDQFIHVAGSPYEMGFEHGKACRARIEYAVRAALLKEINKRNTYTFDEAVSRAMTYMAYGREYAPHLDEEIQGIADGAGLLYEEICMLQVRSELAYPASLRVAGECSSVAVQAESPRAQTTLIGQNIDMGEELESLGIALHLEPNRGPRILTWTLAGVVGQTGLNSSGLARCGNVLFCAGWRVGVPTSFLFRRILEQETIEAASELCRGTRRAKSNNIVLAHADGQIVNIEMTVDDERFIQPQDHTLYHTNHYIDPDFENADLFPDQEDSRIRLDRLQQVIETTPQLDETALEQLLCDHANAPHSICKHIAQDRKRLKTVASCVMTPSLGRLRLSFGNPCKTGYATLYV
jgi:isopenicillin-N N-acyltransferase-like protein